jgi:hypothetical protein
VLLDVKWAQSRERGSIIRPTGTPSYIDSAQRLRQRHTFRGGIDGEIGVLGRLQQRVIHSRLGRTGDRPAPEA